MGFVQVGAAGEVNDGTVATLHRLYVHPDHWGDGLGSRLLAPATADLRERGFDRLRLEVFAENEVGVCFYESRGFARVDEETEAFGGETHAVYVYEKPL